MTRRPGGEGLPVTVVRDLDTREKIGELVVVDLHEKGGRGSARLAIYNGNERRDRRYSYLEGVSVTARRRGESVFDVTVSNDREADEARRLPRTYSIEADSITGALDLAPSSIANDEQPGDVPRGALLIFFPDRGYDLSVEPRRRQAHSLS